MIRTTPKHFQQFKAASVLWADRMGLADWSINYFHVDMGDSDDAPLATCNSDMQGAVATITLNTKWPDHVPPTREKLSQVAFHELCHVLLAELVWLANNRICTDNLLTKAQHSIIRRMERMQFA
jgi:hypothetical protein